MKFNFRLALLGLIFLLASANAFAAKRYWISGSNSKWNLTANWASTSGGAGGVSVPGVNDTAYFDGGTGGTSADGNDTLDINISIKRLEISNTYNGAFIQGTKTVTIGTSGAVLSGGTFSGGSAAITLSGAFTISGCAFTSTSGTFSTSANFTFSSGSFTHNSGTVSLTATSTFTISKTGGATFYNLAFAPTVATATFTITSTTTITVSHLVTVGGNKDYDLNGGTFHCTGNITVTNTLTGSGNGTMTFLIDGSGTQTITGTGTWAAGRLPKITITKSAADTLKLLNAISVAGNWTYNSGIINYGSSAVIFLGGQTITGTHRLGIVQFYGQSTYTITSGDTLKVAGILYLGNGGLNPILNTGIIRAQGDIDISTSTSGANGGGTATILIADTAAQSLLGSTTGGAARICNIKIAKSSGTLTISDKLTILGNWTHTSGTINPTTSTLLFGGNRTITESDTLYNVTLNGSATSTYTIASGTTLTVAGLLKIEGTAAVTINTGTIHAHGDITVTNTSASGGGSALIIINGRGTQLLTGSGTASQGRLPKITIDKTSGTLTLASIISVANNWTYVQGTVNASTNLTTVSFYGALNLDAQGTSSTMSFYNVTTGGSTTTLTGNLNVVNTLTINSSTTLSAGSNTIQVGGNWRDNGTWTFSTSTVTFNGNVNDTISKASGTETFYNLTFNHAARKHTLLANPVKVNNALTMTKGKVLTTTTNILTVIDNATLSGGNDSAYVHGPVRKIGNDAFTFPVGDTTVHSTGAYHPLYITAPSSTGDTFAATYFAAAQSYGSAVATGDTAVSTCQYWTLKRNTGSSSTPTASLTWNSNCNNTGFNEMRELLWNGSLWTDLGQASVTIANSKSGTLVATSATSFTVNPAPLTIGYKTVKKSYCLLAKTVDGGFFNTDGNELYFGFDEEYKDGDGVLTYSIRDLSNNQVVALSGNTNNSSPAVSYGNNHYRLDLYNNSNSPLSSGYYMLEVTNEKNETWYLRFKI